MNISNSRIGLLIFIVVLSAGCSIRSAELPKQEQTKIISACMQFFEALRLNHIQQLVSLTDERTTTGVIIKSKKPWYIDHWKQSLRLENKTTPIDINSLAISVKCPWSLMKDLIAAPYILSAQKRLISPSTVALVEFQYLQDHPPVLVPMIKSNNKWLIVGMPELNVRVYKFKHLNDMYKLDSKDFLSYCIDFR